jgi:type I restriction enzyme, S subunit
MASDHMDVIGLPFDVPGSWKKSRLSQHCQFVRDGDWIESKDQGGDAYRLLQISNIGVGEFVETGNYRWITAETFQRLNCTEVRDDDVLVARMPEPTGRAWHVAALPYRAVTAVDVAIIRAHTEDLDPRFLAYFLNSPACLALVKSLTTGTTRLRIRRADIERLQIPLPPPPEQRAIAHILGTLDDKIQLNQRMSATLEAMAHALFKSWFVDFDPVRAKAEERETGLPENLAALFPDRLVESEHGEVPQGWTVVTLPTIIDVNPSRPLRKGEVAPYLDMANMPTRGHAPDRVIDRPFGSGMRFMNGDTLVARITPCLENGKTAFVDFLAEEQVGWGSTEYIVLCPRDRVPPPFGYLLARDERFREFCIQHMTGTSGRQRVPASALDHYELVCPPGEDVLLAFGGIVLPLFTRSSMAVREARTLTALRDALLPKLVSGELRVSDAERVQEQIAS